MIEQGLQIQLGLACSAGHQIFQTGPTERVPVEQHLLKALTQLGIGILHQPPGEVGVGSTEDLEVRIHTQGDALQGDQRPNDQGVVRRHPEGEFVHHTGHVVGDRFEIHAVDAGFQGLAEDLLKGGNNRFQVHVFRQESQGDEVFGELPEVPVHQMNHRLNQAGA